MYKTYLPSILRIAIFIWRTPLEPAAVKVLIHMTWFCYNFLIDFLHLGLGNFNMSKCQPTSNLQLHYPSEVIVYYQTAKRNSIHKKLKCTSIFPKCFWKWVSLSGNHEKIILKLKCISLMIFPISINQH